MTSPTEADGEYYHDLLTQLGFNATLKVIAGDNYLTTIGNESTPDLDTGFADWFQDFPHPNDFFRPLLHGDSILPTNSNNFSRIDIPPTTQRRRAAAQNRLGDGGVEEQYADLDKDYMEQAPWAPYGTSKSRPSSPSTSTSTSPTTTCCSTRTTRASPSSSRVEAMVAPIGELEAPGEPPLPTGVPAAEIEGRSPWYLAWLRLRRNSVALACGGLFVVIVLFCLAAPLWADHVAHTGPNENHITER